MIKDIKFVIGSNYGDEGKGLVTDYFVSELKKKYSSSLVVLSSGGMQRGHTVVTPDDKRFVFHSFSSGTFAEADTYYSENFIFNPTLFRQEYEKFYNLGYKIPKVYIHKNCRFSTIFDMILNNMIEEYRGNDKHGSVGVGIWETIRRYNISSEMVSISEFYDFSGKEKNDYLKNLNKFFKESINEYNISSNPEVYNSWWDIIGNSINIYKHTLNDFEFCKDKIIITDNSICNQYESIVFENSQGLLLDENYSNDSIHSTPSSCGLDYPIKIVNTLNLSNLENIPEVCYVSRSYITRHGAGPLKDETNAYGLFGKDYDDPTNVWNSSQEHLRFSRLNYIELNQRTNEDFYKHKSNSKVKLIKSCCITHVDEIEASNDLVDASKAYISYGRTRENVKIS